MQNLNSSYKRKLKTFSRKNIFQII